MKVGETQMTPLEHAASRAAYGNRRRKIRRSSTGVILQRMRGRWDDEVSADGGKAQIHRQVRHQEKSAVRRLAADEIT